MADELDGTAGETTQGDPPPADTPASTASATEPGASNSFINPADLPPELKPHWSRMHSAYTKALNRTKDAQGKADQVDRFWNDEAFARESIQEWARRAGVQITFGQPGMPSTSATPAPSGASGVPPELVQAIEAELPAELRWMARPLAASTWKAQGQLVAPILRESRQKEVSAKSAEYDTLASELSETAPGWEEHEDDMTELLTFLQSGNLRSRRWGSKLELLHTLVTGNASATRAAVRRMGEAARNRTTTGVPGRSTTTNIEDRVRGAKTNSEAWQIAAEHAVEELRRNGLAVP